MRTNRNKNRSPFSTEQLEPRMLLAADVFISEFSASNADAIRDGDREYPDWD